MCKQLTFILAFLYIFLFIFITKEASIAQSLFAEDQIFTTTNDTLGPLTAQQEKKLSNIARRPTTADLKIVYGQHIRQVTRIGIDLDGYFFSFENKIYPAKYSKE